CQPQAACTDRRIAGTLDMVEADVPKPESPRHLPACRRLLQFESTRDGPAERPAFQLGDRDAARLDLGFEDRVSELEALSERQCVGLEVEASVDMLEVTEVERLVLPLRELCDVSGDFRGLDLRVERQRQQAGQGGTVGLQVEIQRARLTGATK